MRTTANGSIGCGVRASSSPPRNTSRLCRTIDDGIRGRTKRKDLLVERLAPCIEAALSVTVEPRMRRTDRPPPRQNLLDQGEVARQLGEREGRVRALLFRLARRLGVV